MPTASSFRTSATNQSQLDLSWPNSNDIESFFDTTDMIDWVISFRLSTWGSNANLDQDTWEAFVLNAPSAQ